MRIVQLLQRRRRGLALALVLITVERVAWIAEPSAFGPVIDAFLDWRTTPGLHLAILPLVVWIGLYATNTIVGALRRTLDAGIFGRIFADMASEISRGARDQGVGSSVAAARAELSREFIEFLQFRLPEAVEEIIGLIGSVIGLAVYDWRLAATATATALPLAVMIRWLSGKVGGHQSHVHGLREQGIDVFASADPEQVRAHYLQVAASEGRIARIGGTAFALMRLCLLGVFLVVLYVAIDLDGFTTGNIYSIVSYLWTFIVASESLPEVTTAWTSLRDLSQRLVTSDWGTTET